MASTSKMVTVDGSETNRSENSELTVTATSSTKAISSDVFACDDFSYCDDPKGAKIDETFMPAELRGKIWKAERALGEGQPIKSKCLPSPSLLLCSLKRHFNLRR